VAEVTRREALAVLAMLALAACRNTRRAAEWPSGRTGRTGMHVTRIYTGDDGRSHFEDVTLPEHAVRAGVVETEWFDAARVSLRFLAPMGDFVEQPRHVAPRRQVAVITNGALEVECAKGETRQFGVSAVVFLEDVQGEGHITRVMSSPCAFVQIALGDGEASGALPMPFTRP
jgi:hypothetical protein